MIKKARTTKRAKKSRQTRRRQRMSKKTYRGGTKPSFVSSLPKFCADKGLTKEQCNAMVYEL